MNRLRHGVMIAAFIFALLFVGMGSAEAGNCAAGQTCTINLTNTNVTGVSVTIAVTINNTGAATVLTFAFVSDNITNTALGIDQIAWTGTVGADLTKLPASWSQQTNTNMDGFGKFGFEIDQPGGTALSFTFTLAGLVTSFPDNANGAEFAAHIRYSGSCSAFVSDGIATGGSDANCTVQAPETSSLPLLGVCLIMMGLAWRRISRIAIGS